MIHIWLLNEERILRYQRAQSIGFEPEHVPPSILHNNYPLFHRSSNLKFNAKMLAYAYIWKPTFYKYNIFVRFELN